MTTNIDTMRPMTWDGYIGQARLKSYLKVRIASAQVREAPLDHMLLCGPAGSGKTSLAQVIACTIGDQFRILTMPITLRALTDLVRSFQGIVIMDEIHRASKRQQEDLLPLLEFGYVQTPGGQRVHTECMTVIGTTTERQSIIKPLWDRFATPDIDDYSDDEMAEIVICMAIHAKVDLSVDDAVVLGKAAGGIPRHARQLVLAMRDLAAANKRPATAAEALEMCRTSVDGLTVTHMRYLKVLETLGGTAGLKTLASLLELNESVVEDHERLLLGRGLIGRSERGREITGAGSAKLAKPAKLATQEYRRAAA